MKLSFSSYSVDFHWRHLIALFLAGVISSIPTSAYLLLSYVSNLPASAIDIADALFLLYSALQPLVMAALVFLLSKKLNYKFGKSDLVPLALLPAIINLVALLISIPLYYIYSAETASTQLQLGFIQFLMVPLGAFLSYMLLYAVFNFERKKAEQLLPKSILAYAASFFLGMFAEQVIRPFLDVSSLQSVILDLVSEFAGNLNILIYLLAILFFAKSQTLRPMAMWGKLVLLGFLLNLLLAYALGLDSLAYVVKTALFASILIASIYLYGKEK